MTHEEDFKLLDLYHSFSAEVVRVSLLAIGAVGTLYTLKPGEGPVVLRNLSVQHSFICSIGAFGVAIALSLLHRYWATDFMACQIRLDRLRSDPPVYMSAQAVESEIRDEVSARRKASRCSKWTVWGGPLFMAIGAACLAYAFGCIVRIRA
jgi:hypothetical protein